MLRGPPDSLACSQAGYRHLDCASFYANERAVGDAIKRSGIPREELFVTGKVWNDCQGRAAALASFARSLADLQIGYFDLVRASALAGACLCSPVLTRHGSS